MSKIRLTALSVLLALLLALLLTLPACCAAAEAAQPAEAPAAETAESPTAEAELAPSPTEPAQKAEWTVLLYLCGTDLESAGSMATYNLEEIAKTSPSEAVNFVIETGGAKAWHAKESLGLDIATDKLQRYHYDKDGYALDEELPLENMASAATLTDFVKWGAMRYPAEKYLLLLWDHGGGSLTGLISDELHNDAIMPLDQLEIALRDANVPLEALALDTCLMASLETAQAVKDSVKYLIASEETVPGMGSAYEIWLKYLYNNPACSGARFGKVLCDATLQKYAELGMSSSARQLTFSVIDLSKIDAVGEAFDKLFLEVSGLLADPERFNAFGYFTQHMQHYRAAAMVDLSDMAGRAQNKAISNETANDVIEAVDAAVVYNIKGDQRSYSHGLSFYYNPAESASYLDHYARFCKSAPYLAFLDAANMNWTAPGWVYEKTPRVKEISRADYIVTTQVNLSAEGLPLLTITNAPRAAAKVDAKIYQYDKSSNAYLALGDFEKLDGSFDTGLFTAAFPEKWVSLNGSFCYMGIAEETTTHTLFNIPFLLDFPEIGTFPLQFRAAYLYDTPQSNEEPAAPPEGEGAQDEAKDPYAGHYEFYGVWDQDDSDSTALPSRSAQELSSYYGCKIQTELYRVTLPDHADAGISLSKAFTLGPDLRIEEKALPKGEYALVFQVTDVFGQTQMTEPVLVSWNGKTARYSGAEPVAAEPVAAEPVAAESDEAA